jgi:hypothetical protein
VLINYPTLLIVLYQALGQKSHPTPESSAQSDLGHKGEQIPQPPALWVRLPIMAIGIDPSFVEPAGKKLSRMASYKTVKINGEHLNSTLQSTCSA